MFGVEVINEALYYDDFEPTYCNDSILVYLSRYHHDKVAAYKLLYDNPVCKIGDNDRIADPMFRERTIVNPYHITFQRHLELHRFNAFVLHYNAAVGLGQWILDLDYPINIDRYQFLETNAPVYS